MKSLWKQSGLVCADAGTLSPLGGRSRRRARLTVYGFAVAFAAFTAYVAFTASPAGAGAVGAGGGASWFGSVYASTAPYRSQISGFFSSIFPANSSAPSPEPTRVPAGGSSGGGGEVSRDGTIGQVGGAAGSNSSAAAGSNKQLGSGGGDPISNAGGGSVPPPSDLAGTGISAKGGGGAPTNNSITSGAAPSGVADRNKGSDRGVSSSQAGGGSGSPASSSAGNGTAVNVGEQSVDRSNKQSGSGSGAPRNGSAGHGSTAKTEAEDTAGVPTNNSAESGSSAKADLSIGSSSNQAGSGSRSAVPSSGSSAGNSTTVKADAKGAVGAASSGSAGSGTDTKADLNKGSDAQPGSGSGYTSKPAGSSSPAKSADTKADSNNGSDAQRGSGDASYKSAGSSSPAKSNAGDGGLEHNEGTASVVPTSNQTDSLALAGEKEGGSSRKNHTIVASPAVQNQEQSSSGVASGGSSGTVDKQKGDASQGSAGSSKDHSAQTIASDSGNNSEGNEPSTKLVGSSSANKKVDWFKEMASCDMFHGSWVRDDSYPLYPEGSCPHIDEPFDCYLNGRRDLAYQKLRWQPSGCSIPRLNPTDMLEKLRGKRLVFVGDSLNRNMWESLVCILRNSVKDKRKVFEASGRHEFKTEGSYSFVFTDYNCSVEFFRSPFLVQEWEVQVSNEKKRETLRLDLVEQSSPKYKDADFLIFNTGHWWTHEKTALGKDYYQEGNHVYSELNVVDAFHKALVTWSKWIDTNVNPRKTTVLFRGYSASHFSGGQWNSGGSCDKESEPITNEQYLSTYPPKMSILEDVIHKMKTPVVYLNITRMTDYRKDAHPSIFRKQNLTDEERRSPERYQDCSHWCLPGVPDSWNELLYAQLLIKRHQMLQQ
ncbi:protein trichome birefringence-like [Phragmites australis]|uniref:protein trichome birefringence-like n=1 Tax=Phragmites australis TaxID=29695 RepID=UPI002D772327|nr:protein trichome birefringence-like [Phragmites australis]